MSLHVTSETPWYGFLVTWPTFENSKTSSALELLTVKDVHIICYMLSFPSTFIKWWCCTCEELESIKKAKKWGVFYRCEEYAWMLYEFWERTYFSHICEILVWNPWHTGTNSSCAVKNWYQLFTVWNLRSVKFTVQHHLYKILGYINIPHMYTDIVQPNSAAAIAVICTTLGHTTSTEYELLFQRLKK